MKRIIAIQLLYVIPLVVMLESIMSAYKWNTWDVSQFLMAIGFSCFLSIVGMSLLGLYFKLIFWLWKSN